MDYDAISQELTDIQITNNIATLCGSVKNPDESEQEEFLYLYLRVLAGMGRVKQLDREYQDKFWDDFEEYARMFYAQYMRKYGGPGNVYTYVADLLTFTGDYDLRSALTCLPKKGPEPYLRNCEIGDCLVYAAIGLAEELLEKGAQEQAETVLKSLLRYSSEHRNGSERHAALAAYLLFVFRADLDLVFNISEYVRPFFEKHKQTQGYQNYLWFRHYAAYARGDMEDASETLAECILIREQELPHDNWLVVLAKARFFVLFRLITKEAHPYGEHKPEREYVEAFVEKATQNGFENWSDPEVRKAVGELLSLLLRYVYMPNDRLTQHKDWLELYHELCREFNEDPEAALIKSQVAKHLEGATCLENNDLIGAEQAFQETLEAEKSAGAPEILSVVTNKLNLLTTYYKQADYEKADELMLELFREMPEEIQNLPEWISIIDYRIGLAQMFQEDDEDLNELLSYSLDNAYEEICVLEEDEYMSLDEPMTIFLLDAINFFVSNRLKDVSENSLLRYLTIVEYMMANEKEVLRREAAKVSMTLCAACIHWRLKDGKAGDYARNTIVEQRGANLSPQQQIGTLAACAHILVDSGYNVEAKAAILEMFDRITENWHSAVRYYNNTRLESFLIPAQINFAYVSGLLRPLCDKEETYGYVLRFKALASLAGRERNRFLRNRPEDGALIKQINDLQDKVAQAELGTLIHENEHGIEADRKKLRKLEAELAKKIPTSLDFVNISLGRVLNAIPNNCAVLEYQLYVSQGDQLVVAGEMLSYPVFLDIYLITKEDGKATVKKHTLTNCNDLIGTIDMVEDVFRREFLDKRDPEAPTMDEISVRDEALYDLYDRIIRPFRAEILSFRTLFVAPDQMLNAIPFEILRTDREAKTRLSDECSVIRIDSARDFLFASHGPIGTESLILGNPQYDAFSNSNNSVNRLSGIRAESVKQLPFSEFEADRVAEICKTKPVVGARAVKSVLTDHSDYGLIHLATHGFFDATMTNNAVYSSFLLFAGAKTWMSDQKTDPVYGNGIITADEISRLDLRKVKLVVLSACFSGMTDPVVTQNLRGLLGGFAAAGVQYVITQQWSANDVATSVLMQYFYDGYIRQQLEPANALAQAKMRLRETTIAELDAMGVIQYGIEHASGSEREKNMFERLRRRPPTSKPFSGEYYWGGFSCHRCW